MPYTPFLYLVMATQNNHTYNIFPSGMTKAKAGMKHLCQQNILQQDISDNPPGSLYLAPDGDPSYNEEMPGIHYDQ